MVEAVTVGVPSWNDPAVAFTTGTGVISITDAPFNAVGDGVTDATAAINNAISAARQRGGGTIRIPAGKYLVSGSINLTEFTNNSETRGAIVVSGDGGFTTQLLTTVNGAPVLDLTGSSKIRLQNFSIRVHSGIPTELILLARDSTDASAGLHLLEFLWLQGSISHALITCLGSEQNTFINIDFLCGNDGPCFSGCMTSMTPPGGNLTPAGWLPHSPFTTIGTGNGGTGENNFLNCDFTRPDTVNNLPIVNLWGTAVTSFWGCFFGNRGTSVDMRAIPNPINPASYYISSATFDTCADEGTVNEIKNSIRFSDGGVRPSPPAPTITGCHIRNCQFFAIQGEDNVWVDGFQLSGGTTGFGATIGQKLSIWRLDNAQIFPSASENNLVYQVRNESTGIVFGGLPAANISLPPGAIFSHLDDTTGALRCSALVSLGSVNLPGTAGIQLAGGHNWILAELASNAFTINDAGVSRLSIDPTSGAVTIQQGVAIQNWFLSQLGAGNFAISTAGIARFNIDPTIGNVNCPSGLAVNGGVVKAIVIASGALTFPATPAQSSSDQTMAFAGALAGFPISMAPAGPFVAAAGQGIFVADSVTSGNVTVRFVNHTAAAIAGFTQNFAFVQHQF